MRYLFDIGHPKDIHTFKLLYYSLTSKGNKCIMVCRDRMHNIDLMRAYKIDFILQGKHYKSLAGKLLGLVKNEFQLIKISLNFKPDIYISHNSTTAGHVSRLFRKQHIAIEDTFNMEQMVLSVPFVDVVLTGDYPHPSLGKKEIHYPGYHYKSYIEDLILGMEQVGVLVLPAYKYLRANNNKVFMEILRKQQLPREYFMSRRLFGCFEELESVTRELRYPVVVKSAAGAGSTGVFIAGSKQELFAKAKRISQTRNIREELREIVRSYRHRGYIRESRFREKFIVQDFIPGLTNDWKVLVYYDKYYVLRRNNRPGDFKASGSGLFYFEEVVDQDLLNAAQEICDCFQLPMMSLDLAKSGTDVYLIEIQFLYFGTSTLEKSPYYYIKEETSWKQVHAQSVLESEYARSITKHIFGKV